MRYAALSSRLPASTGGVCAREPDAASFALPSNLGASQPCDAVAFGVFLMMAFAFDHPFIVGLFLGVICASFAAAFVGDGHWKQPEME